MPETEIATMRFVRQHTSIPVPEPHCFFHQGDQQYIVMSRVPGTSLHELNWKTLSPETQASIVAQLKCYFEQLRSIPRPDWEPESISSVLGGPFLDARLREWDEPVGPFATEADFNTFYRAGKPLDDKVPEEIRSMHSVPHRIVLTHNDLCPQNIMVDGSDADARITAILDWECAAWLPEYWEYVKVTNWKFWVDRAFKKRAPEFLTAFPEESIADKIAEEMYIP